MIGVVAMSASCLIGDAVLENLLVLGRQRGLLQASPTFGLIE